MKVLTRLFFFNSICYFLIQQFLLCLRYRYKKLSSHEMTQNAYIQPKSLYTIIPYIRVGIWVISSHDCYLPLSFDSRMSLNVYRAPILFYPVQGSNMFFCSFWNLALCQILPCTHPLPLPTPLCFGFHCL